MTNHAAIMQRALRLAMKGKGQVHPNPLVGCVLVKNGRILSEGYHSTYGGPHAEQIALSKAGSRARGATLYINLEPCVHWGKTPPCAPALLSAGIREVYVSIKDPNPRVNGRGLALLKRAGVKIHLGLESESARNLNRAFLTWMAEDRPYVILKMAQTLDGKIASRSGDSKWVSGPESRLLVHRLRAESDAVLVGAQTALQDNPVLTSHGAGRNPVRIVLDPRLRTPGTLKLYRRSKIPTWTFTGVKAPTSRLKKMKNSGHKILRTQVKGGLFNLKTILTYLSKNNVSQLLVEGGGETAWSFLSKGLVDELYFFFAPKILGGKESPTSVGGQGYQKMSQALPLKSYSAVRLGEDVLIKGSFR